MVVLMALVVNSIVNSPLWQNETKALTLTFGIILLGALIMGLSFWYPIANHAKYQHQTIQRYLKWAERDLKEEQLF